MRLARGSGLDGLSAMAEDSMVHGLRVLRPLLDVERLELRAFLKAQGQAFFDDPSNDNPRFRANPVPAGGEASEGPWARAEGAGAHGAAADAGTAGPGAGHR